MTKPTTHVKALLGTLFQLPSVFIIVAVNSSLVINNLLIFTDMNNVRHHIESNN